MADASKQAVGILAAARIALWMRFPYYWPVLGSLRFVERPSIGTLAVDDGMRLFYDSAWVVEVGTDAIVTVLAHEVQHVVRKHASMGNALWHEHHGRFVGVLRQVRRWLEQFSNTTRGASERATFAEAMNILNDAAINDDLNAAGVPWPQDYPPVLPKMLELPDGKSEGEYLVALIERMEKEMADERNRDAARKNDVDDSGNKSEMAGDGSGSGQAAEKGRAGIAPDESEQDDHDGTSDGDDSGGDAKAIGEGKQDGTGADTKGGARDGSNDNHEHAPARPGAGCCGSCSGHAHDAEAGPCEVEAVPEGVADLMIRQVACAALDWEPGSGRGVAPGKWLVKMAREMMTAPKADPFAVLAQAVRSSVAAARDGNDDMDFGPSSPDREIMISLGWKEREVPILPVEVGADPRVALVVDVSGSMGTGKDSSLAQAISETWNIVRNCGAACIGLAVDAGVQHVRPLAKQADALALADSGHGGTDMRIGIKEAGKKEHAADLIVLLTDGLTPWPTPSEMPRVPVVVVIIGSALPPPHMRRGMVRIPTQRS